MKRILLLGFIGIIIAYFLPLKPTKTVTDVIPKPPVAQIQPLVEPLPPEPTATPIETIKPIEPPPPPPQTTPTSGVCADWMAQAGIAQTTATIKLILNESGCRTWAVNPISGACGIPQAYPCSKLGCPLNDSGAVCQLQWMDNYVKAVYGTWDNALAKWYSRCGSPQGCWY